MEEPLIEPMPSEIKPIDKRFLKLPNHSILPSPPFTMAVIGSISSGKTSFVYTLLNKLYKNYFDELIVCCATLDSKASWEKINQRSVLFLNDFDDQAFMEYIKEIEQEQLIRASKNKYPLRVCLVLDDIVFEGFNRNRAGTLEKLMMTCRHYNISIILALQHTKQISPAMRNQIMYYVLFRLTANDLKKVCEEHSNSLTSEQFEKMYNDIQEKGKHEFMIINYKRPMNERFSYRFTKPIDLSLYK